jgi:two-component system, NarL family, invasion response regulator UvrY
MTTIVVADDHPLIREGLKNTLAAEHDLQVVGEAGTAEEVMDVVQKRRPHVLILDISMPGSAGLTLLERVKGVSKKTRILVLSMHPEKLFAVRALKEGASGYISKATVADVLVPAIRKVAGGGVYVSPAIADQLASSTAQAAAEGQPHERLSERELEVFLLLAVGKTVGQVAEDLHLSKATVSTYRNRILSKTGLTSNAEMVQYAYRHGILT